MYYVIFVFPVIAVLDLLCYVPIALICKYRKGKTPFLRHLACYGFVGVVMMMLYATIFWYGIVPNFHVSYHFLNLKPFVWINETYAMGWGRMIEQLILNIIMFVPFGLLLPVIFCNMRRLWRTGLVGLVLTLMIEILQYFTGRSADIDDVIMNVLGTLIGYLCYKLASALFHNRSWWKTLNKA